MADGTHGVRTVAGAVLVTATSFGVYNSLVSPPSSVAFFDPARAESCRPYLVQADVINVALGASSALLSRSWAPFLGTIAVVVYMHALYERAIGRSSATESFS